MCSYIYAPFLPNFSLGVLNPHVLVCWFLLYGNCRLLPNAPMSMQCFIDKKLSFKKNSVVPIVLARNTLLLQLIQFALYCLLSGCLQEIQNKGKF